MSRVRVRVFQVATPLLLEPRPCRRENAKTMAAGAQRLHELAVQKEQELQRLREQQQHALENALKSCQEELGKQKARERELEQDFRYNLSLIQQRDEELAKYELAFSELKKVVNGHISETSDLKVQLDETSGRIQQLEEEKQQLKQYYINRLDQQQRQLDAYRAAKDEELSHHHREYEALQCKLQQRLVQVEEELAVQKLQLVNQFDDVSRRQEHEHRIKMDQLSGVVMSKEAQVRQLQRELVVAQSTAQQSQQDSSEVGERVREMEKKMREKEWDYTDTINAKDTRITELESQLCHSQAAMTTLQSDCELRYAELERAGKEKEKILLAAKEAHAVRERELESTIRELQVSVEQHEADRRKRQWEIEDLIKEKQIAIERLREEITKVKEKEQEQVSLLTQDKVALDLQYQSLQQSYQSARAELGRRKEEIEGYKRDLRLATEKERRMERNKAQLELDWQRRLEESEREVCSRQDELIKAVTRTRDEAVAHCAELESKLSDQTQWCEVLQRERGAAMRTLRDNGLAVAEDGEEEEEEVTLRQQNQELRAVIHEMRREMERVSKGQASDGEAPTAGYVQYLETQVAQLKSTQHHLTEQLRTVAHKPPTPTSGRGHSRTVTTPPASEQHTCKNTAVVAALNKTLIALQREKSTFELDMAQLRSRVRQLEGTVTSRREEEYLKRAKDVPSSKVHEKLLQATHVIIQLVRERALLLDRELALKNELNRVLEEEGRDHGGGREDKQQEDNPVTSCSCGSETVGQLQTAATNTKHDDIHQNMVQERRVDRTAAHMRSSPDLSLSPLKFSDSSGISTLLAAERAFKMVDDSLPPSSPMRPDSSTPVVRRPRDNHQQQQIEEALLVHGSRVAKAGRGRGRTKFVAPKLRKPVKPTVRNYNNKE